MPVIGYLDAGSLETRRDYVAALQRGLSETGYFEGRNLAVEYRWAEDRLDRLPALAADLVHRQVAVIFATLTPAALAAKAVTKSVPIVFSIGVDPVEAGLVASLNRPGGNLTGMSNLNTAGAAKRLALLHELVPTATLIAYLINPTNPVFSETETRELQDAARTLGVRLLILKASDPSEFEAAFATLVLERAGGLVVSGDTLFMDHIYGPLRSTCRAGSTPTGADGLRSTRDHYGRRACELWNGLSRFFSPSGGLCGPHSQGRKARRSAGPASNEDRAGHQPQDRQSTRPYHPRNAVGHC
jgi:hypothetical protein